MTPIRTLAVLGAAVLAVTACGSDDDDDAAAASTRPPAPRRGSGDGLEGPTWTLVALPELGVPLGDVIGTATFEAGALTGTSGCNSYSTAYQLNGSGLTIDARRPGR